MKKITKGLSLLLVALFCVSMMACSKTRVVEEWVSDGSQGISNAAGETGSDGMTVDGEDGTNTDGSDNKVVNGTTKKPSNKTTSKNNNTKATTASTTRPAFKRGDNNTVYRNISVTNGAASNYGDAFKGKTYSSLIWTETSTDAYKAELQAFAQKNGCTINYKNVAFAQYLTTISTALSSGNPYDIIRMHGSFYPRILISNLLASLDGSFTSGDCISGNNTAGIDLNKSKYFAWGNSLYSVTTYDDAPIYYMYYNKKLYKQYTGSDPMDLYKAGKWTWEQMKKDGAAVVTSSGNKVMYSDVSMGSKCCVMANNTQLVKDNNGVLSAYISSNTNLINALKFVQGMLGKGSGTGLYESKDILADDGGSDKTENLVSGNIVIWPSESNRYESLFNAVKKSAAFDKKTDNLGIVPFPYGPDNSEKAYPAGWLTSFSAGRGSDSTAPQLVAALCKFHSTYQKTGVQPSAEELAIFNGLYANLNYCDFGYGTADGTMDDCLGNIESNVCAGNDITQTLKKYDDQAASRLAASLSQQ